MKVLIATDGSDYSREAVEKACEMLAGSVAEIQVEIISVYDLVSNAATDPFAISGDYLQELERIGCEQAGKFVSEAEKLVRASSNKSFVEVTTKVIKGSPGKAIVEEAEDWEADLIVVGSHGYGFWKRAVLGSISDRVVHHAPCSVLIVRKKLQVEAGD